MLTSTGNRLFIGSSDGKLYCLDTASGSVVWSFDSGDASPVFGAPSLSADEAVVYIGTDNSAVFAVSVSTGLSIWSYTAGNRVRTHVIVSSLDNSLVFGCDDGQIYFLNSDGTQRLPPYSLGTGNVRSSPTFNKAQTAVYAGSSNSQLHAVSTSTGLMLWKVTLGGAIYSSPLVDVDGKVFVGADDSKV